MKILFPIQYYYPSQIGGPANTLYWHCEHLQKQGFKTTVVASSVGIKESEELPFDKWIKTRNGKVKYCKGGRLNYKIFFNTIKEIFCTDIIHFSSICYPYTIFWLFLALCLGKRIYLSPRGELFNHAMQGKKNLIKRITFTCYKPFQKRITFHATSDEEKITIRKIFKRTSIIVLPNFIDPLYKEIPENRSNDIVFLGRINPIKALDHLIQALSKSESFIKSNAKLLIVGKARLTIEHEYEIKLKKLIDELKLNERVVFVGQKEGEEKNNIINQSKALILPSHSENFGNVIIEALSLSVPVIASTGTPWQVLKETNIGWWVENSLKELSVAINQLYGLSHEEYDAKCRASRIYVEENLDINNSKYNEWPAIYNGIIKRNNKYNKL